MEPPLPEHQQLEEPQPVAHQHLDDVLYRVLRSPAGAQVEVPDAPREGDACLPPGRYSVFGVPGRGGGGSGPWKGSPSSLSRRTGEQGDVPPTARGSSQRLGRGKGCSSFRRRGPCPGLSLPRILRGGGRCPERGVTVLVVLVCPVVLVVGRRPGSVVPPRDCGSLGAVHGARGTFGTRMVWSRLS